MTRKRRPALIRESADQAQGIGEEPQTEVVGPSLQRERRKGGRRRRAPGFYAESLDVAEQTQLDEALEMEGLDEEIALLRVRLRRALEEDPEDTEFLLKSIGLLARLLATRYRLSQKAEDDLYQNILGVIKGIDGAIWPEAFQGDGG